MSAGKIFLLACNKYARIFQISSRGNGSKSFKMSFCYSIFSNLSWITSVWYKMVHTILFLWSLKLLIAFLHHNTHSKASLLWVRGNFLQSAGSGLNPQVDKIVWVEYFRFIWYNIIWFWNERWLNRICLNNVFNLSMAMFLILV